MIMVMDNRNPSALPGLNTVAWWMVFVLATVSLSLLFQAFKAFTLTPGAATVPPVMAAVLLFVVSLGLLVYDGYAKDKAKGKVVKQFAPFEWLYGLQSGASQDNSLGGGSDED